MTNYDFSNLTNSSIAPNPADQICQFNFLTNHFMAYAVVVVIAVVMFIIIMKMNYSIYTAFLPPCFTAALLSTIFRLWQCNDLGMVSTSFMAMWWILTALAAAFRKMVND
jgi:hypothetical protein